MHVSKPCVPQGSGGQSVNRTESAVRVVHIPTGIDVKCQEGKSQHANRERAFQILYAKLQQIEDEKARKEASDVRLEQIGTEIALNASVLTISYRLVSPIIALV